MCKKLLEGATACLFHLPLQAFVAAIMKLKARAGIMFRNYEKSNDGTHKWGSYEQRKQTRTTEQAKTNLYMKIHSINN